METRYELIGRFVTTFANLEYVAALLLAAGAEGTDFSKEASAALRLHRAEVVRNLKDLAARDGFEGAASFATEFERLSWVRDAVVHGLSGGEQIIRLRVLWGADVTPPIEDAELSQHVESAEATVRSGLDLVQAMEAAHGKEPKMNTVKRNVRVLDTTGQLYTMAEFEVSDDWTTRGHFEPTDPVTSGQYTIEIVNTGERCLFVITEEVHGGYALQRIG